MAYSTSFGNSSGTISSAISTAQQGQNKANAANQKRYKQGLDVLNKGSASSNKIIKQGAGFITQAIGDLKNLGREEKRRINQQEKNVSAQTQQSVINRGLGNFTIADSLQRGVRRDANEARQNLTDRMASTRSNLRLKQTDQSNVLASNVRGNAGSIADFIAARNDVGPSLSEYAGLVQGAAADASDATRTGTVIRRPGMDAFGRPAGGISLSGGGGGALGSGGSMVGGGFGQGNAIIDAANVNSRIFGGNGGGTVASQGGGVINNAINTPAAAGSQGSVVYNPTGTPSPNSPALINHSRGTTITNDPKHLPAEVKEAKPAYNVCSDPNAGWIQKYIANCK